MLEKTKYATPLLITALVLTVIASGCIGTATINRTQSSSSSSVNSSYASSPITESASPLPTTRTTSEQYVVIVPQKIYYVNIIYADGGNLFALSAVGTSVKDYVTHMHNYYFAYANYRDFFTIAYSTRFGTYTPITLNTSPQYIMQYDTTLYYAFTFSDYTFAFLLSSTKTRGTYWKNFEDDTTEPLYIVGNGLTPVGYVIFEYTLTPLFSLSYSLPTVFAGGPHEVTFCGEWPETYYTYYNYYSSSDETESTFTENTDHFFIGYGTEMYGYSQQSLNESKGYSDSVLVTSFTTLSVFATFTMPYAEVALYYYIRNPATTFEFDITQTLTFLPGHYPSIPVNPTDEAGDIVMGGWTAWTRSFSTASTSFNFATTRFGGLYIVNTTMG